MSIVIYQRVSSKQQEFIRQEHLFEERGIKPEKVFEEVISGKDADRPKLKAMLEWVREGDTLYIESISRLARNIRDFLDIVDRLERKGVQLISLKESIDTSTATGRFLLSVFGAMAQLERETMKERQSEALEARRSKGLPVGRPRAEISKSFAVNYRKWKAKEITANKFMEVEGLKRTTFYKLVGEYEKGFERTDRVEIEKEYERTERVE